MFSQPIQKDEYNKSLLNVLSEIKSLLKTKYTAYSSEGNALVTDRILTMLRHVQNGTSLERLIKGQILEAALKTEKSGPNSTDMFLSFLIDAVDTINKSEWKIEEIKKELDSQYEDYKTTLRDHSYPAKLEDVEECVLSASKDQKLSKMVLEAVNLAGLEGNIIPSWVPGTYGIELVSGYNFPVSTYPIFTDADKGRWERKEVRALVIDGVIEKESEIHKIFMESAKNKSSILIVARGYGEEVIATIAANKTLDICPIRIPWEVESINFITDISVTCGSHIVSPLKGDMVSQVNFKDLPVVDQVICTRNNLNIINSKTNKSVSNHLNFLFEKREEAIALDMQELITKRIKSLNSHTVNLYIGSINEQQKILELEAIDFGLRVVKAVLNKGTVIPSKTLKEFKDFNDKRPTLSVLSAIHHGISLAKTLAFVEVAILSLHPTEPL
jgi:hypothetical protein